jgi:hypothetical protein
MSANKPPGDLISPMRIAKELGIREQYIYQWCRKGEIKNYTQGGKKMVSRADVEDRARKIGQRAAPGTGKQTKDESFAIKPPLQEGQIVSWHPRVKGKKRRVAIVESTKDRYFTTLRDTKGKSEEWMHRSLRDLLDKGVIAIEQPWNLIGLICKQWDIQGKGELAEALRQWARENHPGRAAKQSQAPTPVPAEETEKELVPTT